MKPIAIFYHAVLNGPRIPSEDYAICTLQQQMASLKQSGLEQEAKEIHVGINGTDSDILTASCFCPNGSIYWPNPSGQSELPTLKSLRHWVSANPGWNVFYFHTKGVSHPGEVSYENWRNRMEQACLWGWRQCVADLDRGYEAVGCHWLTPEKYPGMVTSPFFGGTFWWAKSEYLMQLPNLPEDSFANRFEAESWIGRRRPYPIIRDYYPGWP